jgi:Icc-related predicted phosphoesterase
MLIALASDLHIEFQTITLPNTENADVLILSGDICVAHSLYDHPIDKPVPADAMKPGRNQSAAYKYREFFKRVNDEFPNTIYCSGNHEFYHGRYPDAYDWLREEAKNYNNIHFLDKEHIEIDDVTFVGGTLWTNMNKNDPTTMQLIEGMMNDFRIIRNSQRNYARFSPLDTVVHHRETLAYIKNVVDSDNTKKYVVVGHHAPTPLSIHERYKTQFYMNGGYHSDLSEFILDRPQIALWTCGHVHNPHTYYMGDTLVACNPRGYAGHDPEAANFKLRYIDLENMPAKFDGVNWSRD